MLWEGKEE